MLTLLPLLLSLSPDAAAGTLKVTRRGLLPTYVWVDGQPHGKMKRKDDLVLNLPDGQHEVWVGLEEAGVVGMCHGVVDVSGRVAEVAVSMTGCSGLVPGQNLTGTILRGATAELALSAATVQAWVQVDGGDLAPFPPRQPVILNLSPGTHQIALFREPTGNKGLTSGALTVRAGEARTMTCSASGCDGFDAPPQAAAPAPAPAPTAATPAPAPLPPSNMPAMPALPNMPTMPTVELTDSSAPASGSGADYNCCVNGAFYDCPSADAVNTCTGAFMSCQLGCGMDFSCTERCAESHPIDPSQCSRSPSKDSQCK